MTKVFFCHRVYFGLRCTGFVAIERDVIVLPGHVVVKHNALAVLPESVVVILKHDVVVPEACIALFKEAVALSGAVVVLL